ncbi:hypothetical protein [Fidelibacter multiformis]|uniref:hypothetical protein n=1 Tax=Fidelibacter multiformis TaxID=3377529 RepID=UPI0037DC0613
MNTAKQCWNAERSEAIERHKVPLEYLNATSWCSSTLLRLMFNSRCAAFKPHFMGFKHLTAFGVQTLLRSVQGSHFVRSSIPAMRILMGDFFFEHCEAVLEC